MSRPDTAGSRGTCSNTEYGHGPVRKNWVGHRGDVIVESLESLECRDLSEGTWKNKIWARIMTCA